MITVQYLEDSPELASLSPEFAIQKLREAREKLPFTHLLIGWHLPPPILDACKNEAERLGIKFLLWHPLLTNDAGSIPIPDWQIVGLTGQRVAGYKGMPEFTFICPNHPDARQSVLKRVSEICHSGIYQGIFLDRIRFPSPSEDPINNLGCFCEHCHRKAATRGIDLSEIQSLLLDKTADYQGRIDLVSLLLTQQGKPSIDLAPALQNFLDFRKYCITEILDEVCQIIRYAKLEIGLDCFSPSLASMVGQDINALSPLANWVKLMSYAHTYGPAGIPYEILGLLDFLKINNHLSYTDSKNILNINLAFQLPETRFDLETQGISSQALMDEINGFHKTGNTPILAGVELVELEGVTTISDRSIIQDMTVLRNVSMDGLAISWDLLHIPINHLEQVRKYFLENKFQE